MWVRRRFSLSFVEENDYSVLVVFRKLRFMPNTTIKDVAERAQVSRATVSRVLNNNHRVDEMLRTRVLEAVQALGYQPNHVARRLRAQSSTVIGLVISDIQNPYFLSVIRGVEDAAHCNRLSIVLCNSDEDQAKQQLYLQVMESEHVAGLIIVPTSTVDMGGLERLKQRGIPIVLLDRTVDNLQVDVVKVENVRGAQEAVQHLIDLGHRRIATLAGCVHLSTGLERYRGYRDALTLAGLPVDESLVKHGDFKTESGYRLTYELMALPQPPDAIFVANNMMTLGALRALRELNVRIPEDIRLVGFDDMPWSGELYSPLTSVSQPTYELGQEAVQLLMHRITQPDAPYRTVILHTQLVVRESSGAAVASRR
jgi:DNA-binding LacI/PurR family transcriptional regulator